MKSENLSIKSSIQSIFELLLLAHEKQKNPIFSQNEIEEEQNNIRDLDEQISKLNVSLYAIKEMMNENNKNEKLMYEIVKLHLIVGDLIWQYDQIHEMIIKFGTTIRDDK